MEEVNYIECVKEFHILFEHLVADKPGIPDPKTEILRYNLIKEELEEFKEATERGDIVGVLDALCDIQYVLSGTILSYGLHKVFPKAFKEVHRSNMSKACDTIQLTAETIRKYEEEFKNEKFDFKKTRTGQFLVYRISDGKTVKSKDYSPANLKQFIK